MSRYNARLKNNRILSWGYDEPLREYFLHEEYSPEEIKKLSFDDEEEGDEHLVFAISNKFTLKPHPDTPNKYTYTNGEILTHMNRYRDVIPKAHLEAIASDLSF